MPDDWTRLDASAWTLAGVEQQGLHEHEWYRQVSEPRTWLFKPARPERHRAIGEDIAEKVASELARLVGVPAARVELAERGAVRGVLVEDARPSGWELQHGRVLMGEVIDDYDPDDREHHGHSPFAIQVALARFGPPPSGGFPADFVAFDVFAGYLLFDALVAMSTATTEIGPCWCRRPETSRGRRCARPSTTPRVLASLCQRRSVPSICVSPRSMGGRARARRAGSSTPAGRLGSRW